MFGVLRYLFLLTLVIPIAGWKSSIAGTSSEYNRILLSEYLAHKIGTIWNCRTEQNLHAAYLFLSRRNGYLSLVTAIEDQRVCKALRVTCPFVANTMDQQDPHLTYSYWATRGRYEDTVWFFSDGPGMKMVSVDPPTQTQICWECDWYFQPGECTRVNDTR